MSIDLIHRQLRAARIIAGRSQQSVADEVGAHQSAVSEWENGVTVPTLSSLRSWARSLGHDVVLLPEGARVVVDVPARPGSTSPEPGPPPCRLADWCVVTGPHDAFGCARALSTEDGETP